MSRARGCFITFVVIFFVILVVILIISFPLITSSLKTGGSTGNDADNSSGKQNTVSAIGANNYLFLGVDERGNIKEYKGRTDTIMVYHISSLGRKDVLISIPRDSRVNLEGQGWAKINAAYVYGGEEMLKNEIYELTGIEISKTMMVNFEGFKKVIDALGGVDITVDEPMHDPLSGADFEPGTYHMDGEQALAFARNRKTANGDFDRVDRQKYLITQIIKQKLNFSILTKAPKLIAILNEETKSDFSTLDFVKLGTVLIFSNKDIERVTIPGKSKTIDNVSYVVVDDEEVKEFLSPYLK
jgi:polyisoprenyl-teichoic acid--peptidoglycan teichoic acid transferase